MRGIRRQGAHAGGDGGAAVNRETVERYALTNLIIDLFEASGGKKVSFGVDAGLPGFSSAMCMFYAKKPKIVFDAALAKLRARLTEGETSKSQGWRSAAYRQAERRVRLPTWEKLTEGVYRVTWSRS